MKTIIFVVFIFCSLASFSQKQNITVGTVGSKISDFTLPTLQGQTFSTEALRGKNILIISSRGKYADDHWCSICHYQYADFADIELKNSIRGKYNLEIVFLMPYNKDTLTNWHKAFGAEMIKLEGWKHPQNPESMNADQKNFMEFARKTFPKTFDFSKQPAPIPFPVLVDEKQEVSKGLDLFRTQWGESKTPQNIPAVYLVDKEGVIRFKYISQSTIDRPSSAYIINMIENMVQGKLN